MKVFPKYFFHPVKETFKESLSQNMGIAAANFIDELFSGPYSYGVIIQDRPKIFLKNPFSIQILSQKNVSNPYRWLVIKMVALGGLFYFFPRTALGGTGALFAIKCHLRRSGFSQTGRELDDFFVQIERGEALDSRIKIPLSVQKWYLDELLKVLKAGQELSLEFSQNEEKIPVCIQGETREYRKGALQVIPYFTPFFQDRGFKDTVKDRDIIDLGKETPVTHEALHFFTDVKLTPGAMHPKFFEAMDYLLVLPENKGLFESVAETQLGSAAQYAPEQFSRNPHAIYTDSIKSRAFSWDEGDLEGLIPEECKFFARMTRQELEGGKNKLTELLDATENDLCLSQFEKTRRVQFFAYRLLSLLDEYHRQQGGIKTEELFLGVFKNHPSSHRVQMLELPASFKYKDLTDQSLAIFPKLRYLQPVFFPSTPKDLFDQFSRLFSGEQKQTILVLSILGGAIQEEEKGRFFKNWQGLEIITGDNW